MAGPAGTVGKIYRENGKKYATGPAPRTSTKWCKACGKHRRGSQHDKHCVK